MGFNQKLNRIIEKQQELEQKLDWIAIQCVKEEEVKDG